MDINNILQNGEEILYSTDNLDGDKIKVTNKRIILTGMIGQNTTGLTLGSKYIRTEDIDSVAVGQGRLTKSLLIASYLSFAVCVVFLFLAFIDHEDWFYFAGGAAVISVVIIGFNYTISPTGGKLFTIGSRSGLTHFNVKGFRESDLEKIIQILVDHIE